MIAPWVAQQPIDDCGQRFTDFKYDATLVASTNTVFTVPGVAPRYKMLIKSTASVNIWIALNAAAALPAGASFAASTGELFNGIGYLCREVKAGETVNFISAGTPGISIGLYSMYTNN